MSKFITVVISFAILNLSAIAFSQESPQPLQIHGSGAWQYGKTNNENDYLEGTKQGDYHRVEFALTMIAIPTDRLNLVSQVLFSQKPEGTAADAEIELAFAEWSLSERWKLRIGRVRPAFGIYTEVFDVGTLRPFLTLPQAIYGPSGMVSEDLDGAGVTGRSLFRDDWEIQYDLYGGGMVVNTFQPWKALEVPPPSPGSDERLKNVLGGRLLVTTPLNGLNIGLSGYSGVAEKKTGEPDDGRTITYGPEIEYISSVWSVRSEYAHKKESKAERSTGAYGEVAYRLTEHWQAATRYDWIKIEVPGVDLSQTPSLRKHKDLAFALNYWFTSGFVIKAEYHLVDGNRFALPKDVAAAVAAGELETKTRLILVGVNFSF